MDWTNESDDEAANVRIDFPGERLKEWLASDAGKHNDPESDKPHGVRWSKSWSITSILQKETPKLTDKQSISRV